MGTDESGVEGYEEKEISLVSLASISDHPRFRYQHIILIAVTLILGFYAASKVFWQG